MCPAAAERGASSDMALELRDGDYVLSRTGSLRRVSGREALVQRILFRLTAHRGGFLFQEELGSRLWLLGRIPKGQRQSAAAQYVAEALAQEQDVTVEAVTLGEEAGGTAPLTVELGWRGETLPLALEIHL